MSLHTRLGAAFTAGTLILVLNAYAVVNGVWDWSFELGPKLVPDTAVEMSVHRLPEAIG